MLSQLKRQLLKYQLLPLQFRVSPLLLQWALLVSLLLKLHHPLKNSRAAMNSSLTIYLNDKRNSKWLPYRPRNRVTWRELRTIFEWARSANSQFMDHLLWHRKHVDVPYSYRTEICVSSYIQVRALTEFYLQSLVFCVKGLVYAIPSCEVHIHCTHCSS